MVTINLPRQLSHFAAGSPSIALGGVTLRESLRRLHSLHPRAYERIITESGQLREHINIFVNRKLVRDLDGPEAVLKDGDEITILPAISGG